MSRYKPYPKYKDSGVEWLGEVPEGWEPIRFKHTFFEKKKTLNANLDAGQISFGNVIFKDNDKITEETKESYQEVLNGEFLVNPLNLNYDLKSLRTALSEINCVVSTGYIVLKTIENEKKYLRWLLYQFDIAHMKTLGAGVRQTVNFADIGNCYYFKPSEKEQIAIASFIDRETAKIDELIAKQERMIELLGEKRQALISHAVTKGLDPSVKMKDSGVEWLGEVPEHWVVNSLKHVSKITLGKMLTATDDGNMFLKSYLRAKNIQWFNVETNDINEMWFTKSELSSLRLQKDDLLVSEGGEVGRTCIWNNELDECYIQNSVNRVRILDGYPKYFLYQFFAAGKYGYFDAIVNRISIAHLTKEKLGDAKFVFAPFAEQQAIADYLDTQTSKIDTLIQKAKQAIELLKERRTALISAAVTGKIDVRDAL